MEGRLSICSTPSSLCADLIEDHGSRSACTLRMSVHARWRQRRVEEEWKKIDVRYVLNWGVFKAQQSRAVSTFPHRTTGKPIVRSHWPEEQQVWNPWQPDLGRGSSVTTVTAQGDTSTPVVSELINRSDNRWEIRLERTGLSCVSARVCDRERVCVGVCYCQTDRRCCWLKHMQ